MMSICMFFPSLMLWRGVLDTTLGDKVYQCHVECRGFSTGTPVSSTKHVDCHDVTEILLKVALSTITLTIHIPHNQIKIRQHGPSQQNVPLWLLFSKTEPEGIKWLVIMLNESVLQCIPGVGSNHVGRITINCQLNI